MASAASAHARQAADDAVVRTMSAPHTASSPAGIARPVSDGGLLVLQRAAGNRAVSALLARSSLVAPVVQRNPEWVRRQNAKFDALVTALDIEVTTSANDILDDPLTMPVPVTDGYIDRWTTLYLAYLDDTSVIPPFLYTAFGYAVESLTNYRIGQGAVNARLPHNHTIMLQVSRGPTRPDIVVLDDTGAHVAWLDITSSASKLHIHNKAGSGWNTMPYVAELLYDNLDLTQLGRKGRSIAEGVKVRHAAKAAKADYAERIANLYRYLDEKQNAITTSARMNRETIRIQLAEFFRLDEEELTWNTVRSLIMLPANHEPRTYKSLLGTFGFKKPFADGRDLHTARELLYSLPSRNWT